ELLMDGQQVAVPASRLLAGLSPGLHSFEARKPGFLKSERKIEILEGQTVDASLVLVPLTSVYTTAAIARMTGGGSADTTEKKDQRKATQTEVMRAPVSSSGSFDKEIIRRIIRGHLAEVRACYEPELVKKPKLGGRVLVDILVESTGKVVQTEVKSSTMDD